VTATGEEKRNQDTPRRGSTTRALRVWATAAFVALLVWFILVQKLGAGELFLGLIASCLAATAALLVIAEERLRVRPKLRDVALAVTIPRALLADTWDVLVILARHLLGRRAGSRIVDHEPFEVGPEEDPQACARRALAAAYVSATPRAVVLGFDTERGTVSYHVLEPGPVPAVLERLRRS
jgi:multisubunit Na+/H+ antiporter MnhE subunit